MPLDYLGTGRITSTNKPPGGFKPSGGSARPTFVKRRTAPRRTATRSNPVVAAANSVVKKKAAPKKKTTAAAPKVTRGPEYVYDPSYLNAEQNAMRAAFEDQGMGGSTMLSSAMAGASARDASRVFREKEGMRQFDESLAARVYEMLTAKTLQEAQIRGGFDNLSSNYPNMPANWGYYQKLPYYGYGDPFANMGDPPPQSWSGFAPTGGKTLQGKALDASIAEAASRLAMQRQQLAFQKKVWEAEKAAKDEQTNPMSIAAGIIDGNVEFLPQMDKNGQTTGYKKYIKNTREGVLADIYATTGVNLRDAISDPSNPYNKQATMLLAKLNNQFPQKEAPVTPDATGRTNIGMPSPFGAPATEQESARWGWLREGLHNFGNYFGRGIADLGKSAWSPSMSLPPQWYQSNYKQKVPWYVSLGQEDPNKKNWIGSK